MTRKPQQRPALRPVKKPPPKPAHKPGFLQNLSDHPLGRLFSFTPKAPYHLLVTPPDPWSGNVGRGREILRHRFTFSGQTFANKPVQWQQPDASPDWLCGLHGFEWLRDLRSVGGDQARKMARVLTKDWLLHYKRWDALAWRPDITGARLASWIGLHDFFLSSADDGYRLDVFDAIQAQSRYLLRVLPGQTRGAALITALKGQIYACLALPNSQSRLFQALALLQTEINKQILPDGGHIERNPAAHARVLHHFIDIRGALRSAGLAIPDALQQAIHNMAPMLRFYMHGDGRLAQFNGAGEGDAAALDMILQQAHANGKVAVSAAHSGYERLCQGRSVALLDVGTPPGPGFDTQLHAAPLAFEFSIGRERLVVNCGHAGTRCAQLPMTTALRNSAAHSTAIIADTNAVELRGDGGIGRRPRTVHLHRETTRDQITVSASHDGYQSNFGLLHRRELRLSDNGEELRGQDRFTGNTSHPFTLRFHLSPEVKATLADDNTTILLRLRSGAGWRFKCNRGVLVLEDSIYAEQIGGTPRRTTQITITDQTEARETVVKWFFRRDKKSRTTAEEKAARTRADNAASALPEHIAPGDLTALMEPS